ncbi:hypothetical protein EZ242_09820 [Ramlibacter rhizophilus]|uniref:Uncharacterized protein n=1 Tax=Ramlibacter rhizophilus TaxID=1781167 RepID=A0A4Z0BQQ6_9BURK|nr:hypothetical protein EZ242_09820 [Ramlibacter rhizophilus]
MAACTALLAGPAIAAPPEPPPGSAALPHIDLLLLAQPASGPPTQIASLAPERASAVQPAVLNLGLRWRPAPVAGRQFDAQVWHRVTPTPRLDGALDDEPLYGARVEMQLSAPRRVSLRDLLGMQLDNGARVSLRPRKGKVSLYYRMQF